jgi:hypothetical protein
MFYRLLRPLNASVSPRSETMKRALIAVLIWVAILPVIPSAKRLPRPKVEPVIYQGVRYVAPNDDGRVAYVDAYDVTTGKKKWKVVIFRNPINPTLEEDIQWVFIRELKILEGNLLVTDEVNYRYLLDLTNQTAV